MHRRRAGRGHDRGAALSARLRSAAITVFCAAAAAWPSPARPQAFTQADKDAILDAHNQARCAVNPAAQAMPALVWDADLEATAQAWASSCVDGGDIIGGLIDHNPARSNGYPFLVGENIYGAGGMIASPTTAVQAWVNERTDYTLATNACAANKVCGHYTQVVWANSRRVGCARAMCPLTFLYPSSIVCDYGPAGNFNGQAPYVAGSAVNGACDLIFQDGFEFGNFTPWSAAQTDGADLAIAAAARLTPTGRGLRAVVNDTASLFVADDTPADESRYRARFYLDPNGFDPGEGQGHFRTRVFILFEDGPRRLAAVVLKRQGGAYSLAARARLDDNAQADTPFVTIGDAPHFVEIDWRRSSGPSANDGWLHLWIDGTLRASLVSLDNSLSAVDFVRMGALSLKSGASGTLYFDELESRRQSYIGP